MSAGTQATQEVKPVMPDTHGEGLVTADPMTNAKRLVTRIGIREDLDDQLATIKEEIGQLQQSLIDAIEEERFPNGGKVGGRTLFIKRTLWAGVVKGHTKDDVCKALRDADLGDYVSETFNTNSLSAYVRDVAREAKGDTTIDLSPEEVTQQLPEPLRGRVKVTEKIELGATRS